MKKLYMLIIILGALNLPGAENNTVELSSFGHKMSKWKNTWASPLGMKDGFCQLIIKGRSPMMISPKNSIDAGKIKYIKFKMKLPRNIKYGGHILFKSAEDKVWTDKKLVLFKCKSDGKVNEYVIDMSKNPLWKGKIEQVRFTPCYISDFEFCSDRNKYVELGPGFENELEPFKWRWSEYGINPSYNACSIPVPYKKTNWKIVDFNNNLKKANKKARIVFLGDSITDLWEFHPKYQNGSKIWKKYYVPMNVENFAISGDKTENVLWQLTDGNELQSMKPELFVIMIGVNNVMRGDAPDSIAAGIGNILKVLQKTQPQAKILLLNILPSCLKWDKKNKIYTNSRKVNSIIKSFADDKKIFYLDTSREFLDSSGKVDSSNFYDGLHLTEKGFKTWDKLLRPMIIKLLKK